MSKQPKDLKLPSDWNLVHGYLLGPGKTVNGKFKPGADLTDADFRIENHPLFQDGGVAPDAADVRGAGSRWFSRGLRRQDGIIVRYDE